MKVSKYNKLFKLNENDYVFNSYTCALANVNKEFFNFYDKVKNDENFHTDNKVFKDMIEGGIIVENDCDEVVELEKRYWSNRDNINAVSYTILPTLNCNYNCPYCYEQKSNVFMNEKTINNVIDYIKKTSENKSVIYLAWYGGEPLLAKNIIKQISKEVLAYAEQNDKKLISSMVTNGYYVDKDVIEMFKNYNIKRCQITLDGLETTHNKKRFNKIDNSGSFNRTIENIKKLMEADVIVTIRINIDKNNISELDALLAYLRSVGIDRNSLSIGWLNAITEVCGGIKNDCLDYDEFCSFHLKWFELLMKHGYVSKDLDFYPQLKNACSVINKNSIAINPYGDMFKCWNDIDKKEYSIGNVNEPEELLQKNNNDRFENWSPFLYKDCKECDVLPICLGECPYLAIQNGTPQCSKWKVILDDYLTMLVSKI